MAALGRKPATMPTSSSINPNSQFPRKAGRELGFKREQLDAGLLANDHRLITYAVPP